MLNRMRLVASSAEALRFEGHTRLQAPSLICPLFAALGCLPWLGFAPLSPLRVAVSVAFHAVAIVLLLWGWPRPVHATLRPRAQRLEVAGQSLALGDAARWVLDTWHDDTSAPAGHYVAALEVAGGERFTLIRHAEPDMLLRDLKRALDQQPLPVECRWNIPADAEPWRFESAAIDEHAEAEPDRVCIGARTAVDSLVKVIWSATAFMLLDLVFLVSSQEGRLSRLHPVSIVLPIAFGACLVALSACLATQRTRFSIDRHNVWRETRAFGLTWARRGIALAAVRRLYVVGASPAQKRHVLLDTAMGPLAFPAPAAIAPALARQVEAALAQATSPHMQEPRAPVSSTLTPGGAHGGPPHG